MNNIKYGKINLFTFVDVLVKFKYLLLLSILPSLIVYFFFEPKAVSQYKYVLTVFPKDNPTSKQIVKSLKNVSKDNDILNIAEATSLLIYEDIVENSFRSSREAKQAGNENEELIYSINNILDSDLGFDKIDEKELSLEIEKLIESFQTVNLFNAFSERMDAESLLIQILDSSEIAKNVTMQIEPIKGEKEYLKEYSLATNVPLTDEMIELLIDGISKHVLDEAFLKVESIASILQNKINLKIEFLTQIKDSLIVKYVERANNDKERINKQKKMKQFNTQKIKYISSLINGENSYRAKLIYLISHLDIAKELEIKSLDRFEEEEIKDKLDLEYVYAERLMTLNTHLKLANKLNIKSYRDIGNFSEPSKGNLVINYDLNKDEIDKIPDGISKIAEQIYFDPKITFIDTLSEQIPKLVSVLESSFNDNYYLNGSDYIQNQILYNKALYEAQKKYSEKLYKDKKLKIKNYLKEKKYLVDYNDSSKRLTIDQFDTSLMGNHLEEQKSYYIIDINSLTENHRDNNNSFNEEILSDVEKKPTNSSFYTDELYFKNGMDFIIHQIKILKKLYKFNKQINLDGLAFLEESFKIDEENLDSYNNEFDYYETHFNMNIELLKDLNFKDKINNVMKNSDMRSDTNLIAYYNYIKLFQNNSNNWSELIIALFIATFIFLYLIFLIAHLYIHNKKENESN